MQSRRKRAPHSGIDEAYWDKLDNAAKLFPAITGTRSPNVFRLSAVIRDEVVPEVLQSALEKALAIMPSFAVKLHRGLFWYYFDVNNERPLVREEYSYPCTPIYRAKERGFLFRVTYYHKRINFELYHALSDGMGAVSFMRLIVYCYYNLLNKDAVPEELIRLESDLIMRDFNEDSFVLNAPEDTEREKKREREPEAYRISGYRYDGTRLGALAAVIPTDKMLALAKSHGATLSEYVCALLIFSIYNTSYRRSARNRPIIISIPVNLRGMFDSSTLRNFFGHMNVGFKPGRDTSFEEILEEVKAQFAKRLKRSYFEAQITSHVNIERIPGIRYVPLFIKDMVMRLIYSRTEGRYTMTFSNLGRIQLPEVISDRVERFEVLIGGSQTHPKKTSLCSYKNNLVLMFSSTIDDNSFEQFLLSFLVKEGVEVTVSSNETPAPREPEKVKVKKVKPTKAEKAALKAEKISAKQAKKTVKAEKKLLKKQQRAEKKQNKDKREVES